MQRKSTKMTANELIKRDGKNNTKILSLSDCLYALKFTDVSGKPLNIMINQF